VKERRGGFKKAARDLFSGLFYVARKPVAQITTWRRCKPRLRPRQQQVFFVNLKIERGVVSATF
jgi:hypothetical protein